MHGAIRESLGGLTGEEQILDHRPVAGVMYLTGQMLEEAFEFFPVAIGGREEVGGVDLRRVDFPHVLYLG